jgi:uncharacterized protein YndB with AHSA1/START domain
MTDEFALTVRREIAASAEELFDAWLDAESLSQWLRPSGIDETRAENEPREGGTFRIVMVRDEELVHTGMYRVIDRPRRLVFTWSSPATEHRDSVVTVTFEPSGEATVVEINQVGLPSEESRVSHNGGWTDALRELARFKEATR